MPEGLITLGVSAVQIFASIFANLLFESARGKAADQVKGQMVHAEQFRRVVQTDINEVKEKINSMAQSRMYAAFDYVKRGLIILQGVAPQRTLSQLEKQSHEGGWSKSGAQPSSAIVDYGSYATGANYERFKVELASLIKDAERFFIQADVWATEAFNDKTNVSAQMRLECLRVQLFCALMIHWEKPEQWLALWRNIFVNMISDRGMVQAILSYNPWISKHQKATIKLTLASVVNEAVCSLWKIAHNDLSVASSASQLLHFIRAPKNVLQDKHHESWRNAIGLPMNSFSPWNGRLVVIVPDCFRICPISNNALCVLDRQFKIKLIDSVTLILIKVAGDSFGPLSLLAKKEFACLAYDPVDDLILATQFDPNNELRLFKYDVQSNCLDLVQTLELPEPGYFITCTSTMGRWIFRSASGNVYLKDHSDATGPWLFMAQNVSKIFGALDEPDLNIVRLPSLAKKDSSDEDSNYQTSATFSSPNQPSYCRTYGVRLLADFKITSYYRNPESSDSQDAFFVKQSKTIDLKTMLNESQMNLENGQTDSDQIVDSDHCTLIQNMLAFDQKSVETLIVAQKLENGRLKLSKVNLKSNQAADPAIQLESSSLMPYYLKQSIEELAISAETGVIYLATGRGIEFSKNGAKMEDRAAIINRTIKRLSTHLRIKSQGQ